MKPSSFRLSTFAFRLSAALGAALVCLWLLLCVCAGATDLREELHRLGLD